MAEITATGGKFAEHVMLNPVYFSDPTSENRAFWTATPTGSIDMHINNPQAWGNFIAGREYYIDFILAPQLVPA